MQSLRWLILRVDRQADGFDDAYRLCIALARITIVSEVQKWRFAHHAVQLHLPSALEGNFLQRPREQIIEDETWRLSISIKEY